ncbi:MAG: hypothetical protein WD042_10850 [Phycisphaeraceae bacterium]
MEPPAPMAAILVPDQAQPKRIERDVPCISCGYNLRTLDLRADCPECGQCILDSLHAAVIIGDPAWVRRLVRAMDLALSAVGLGGVTLVIFIPACMILIPDELARAIVSLMLSTLPVALGLWACIWFTWPDPTSGKETMERHHHVRRIARWSAVLLVGQVYFALAIGLARVAVNGGFETLAVFCGVLTAVVGVFAAGRYAHKLAMRAHDRPLAVFTRIVAVGDGLIGCSVLTGIIIAATASRQSPPDLGVIVTLGLCGTVLALPIWGIMTLIAMVWFRVRLAQCLKRSVTS